MYITVRVTNALSIPVPMTNQYLSIYYVSIHVSIHVSILSMYLSMYLLMLLSTTSGCCCQQHRWCCWQQHRIHVLSMYLSMYLPCIYPCILTAKPAWYRCCWQQHGDIAMLLIKTYAREVAHILKYRKNPHSGWFSNNRIHIWRRWFGHQGEGEVTEVFLAPFSGEWCDGAKKWRFWRGDLAAHEKSKIMKNIENPWF